ncbi:bifunctional diaminohydroxyphosphoribosylaminopyrimidine deaminase/5-amino-6-(5-phosphoribosylamino)uracil reductase RibD [Ectothiorhodospira marina]|jgi:diaminohydroxyphosphoribosylaminopyrimidine deaminase/5-amino-6-(5-phosphoribosylamino)uracil reductase|uniref:Riboflavin biosynthesis protein RibD n=1 Tax=Ectothiorhodospira marina TaxID=1396821 RepID=A0A1H7FDQ0_9GAMM|nr:bifunctional diaminohydroxyphosphoribosylaminopyrimidine deaminase/5-amino-6-(5-phosphoribosylamino)uracil reductase RibD [Ectothiorhodospira marina]SEK23417.1 diaminohydroxyphosphoribosylaminopyrimidine deaminase / 5-amino-6-(5-phosphoribosylamino)uracil reductase [Ectothiorhodospira marina]
MNDFTPDDHRFMARALQLAAMGLYTTDPNPRVGCVVVRGRQVVGEGYHARAGEAHAEVRALRAAGEQARDSTVYVTLEPCNHHGRTPPCVDALLTAGVSRVVVAMEDPNPLVSGQGLERLRRSGVSIAHGLMAEAAHDLNPGFISRMQRRRPWVRVKLAASLDGRTAMASGESRWITGEAARQDVQRLRARASALLTGMGTVLADDPRLNRRISAADLGVAGSVNQPLRVVLDRQGQLFPRARLFQDEAPVQVFTAEHHVEALQARLAATGARVQGVREAHGHLDLTTVLTALAALEVNEVHVEAGPRLSGALMQAGYVDELVVYLAPHLMGGDARGLLDLPIQHMADRIPLEIREIRPVGRDWRVTARPSAT